MPRRHARVLAVIALAFFVWPACGGKATGDNPSGAGTSGGSGTDGGDVDASDEDGGASTCTTTRGCPLPPGLVCPTPQRPQLTGTSPAVDRTCVVDGDCASVIFQTDCCGNTLAFGVSTNSVATAKDAADTCQRGFPGCGCPEGATVAETSYPDGGFPTFGTPIDAYCAAGICKTRYR